MTASPFQNVHSSATVSTTEYSIVDGTTVGVPIAHTTQAYLDVRIGVQNMVAGDTYVARIYDKVNGGTARVIAERWVSGAQPGPIVFDRVPVAEGWDITVQRTAGADRVINWSYFLDTSDVNLAAIYEGTRTLQDFLRLAAAVLFGKATGEESGTIHYRDDADLKDRVVGTYSAGNRTPTTRDAT